MADFRPGRLWLNAVMVSSPPFVDDPDVAAAIDEAVAAALQRLEQRFPQLPGTAGDAFRQRLRTQIATLLTAGVGEQPPLALGENAFGDRFSLADLPLPRAGSGYAVQLLGTDIVLDRHTRAFLSVRDPLLEGLFGTFDDAHAAARTWLSRHSSSLETHPLAIVPASFDESMGRHILIYGVLPATP